MFKHFLFIVFFILIVNSKELIQRKTDWNSCVNITTPIQGQTQACVTFVITSNCGGQMSLKIGDVVLFDKQITVDLPPKETVQYQGCALSLELVDINNAEGHFCVQLQATCGPIPVKTYSFGCITDDRLKNCVGCPNNCNNNGNCNDGVCSCYQGWSGYDCSERAPLYEKCSHINFLSLDMCVRVRYGDCKMGYSFLVNNNTIASFYVPAHQLVSNPDNQNCFNYLGCNMCLKTQNFQGSSTQVSACLKLEVSCILSDTIDYGCFQQSGTFEWPCLSCPGNCNGNGVCQQNGSCTCESNYFGDSCEYLKCAYDCNNNGVCNQGICSCFNNYAPPYCAQQVTTQPTNPPHTSSSSKPFIKNNRKLLIGVVVGVLLVVFIIGAVVFWRIRKNRNEQNSLHFASINDVDD